MKAEKEGKLRENYEKGEVYAKGKRKSRKRDAKKSCVVYYDACGLVGDCAAVMGAFFAENCKRSVFFGAGVLGRWDWSEGIALF